MNIAKSQTAPDVTRGDSQSALAWRSPAVLSEECRFDPFTLPTESSVTGVTCRPKPNGQLGNTIIQNQSEQPKHKLTHAEIAENLRAKHRVSPAIQRLVGQNRRQFEGDREAFRAVARNIIGDAQKRLAEARRLDPRAFAQVSDEVLDHLYRVSQTAEALEDVPGMKINVTFTSEVTVNGVRVPDEDDF